MNKKVSLLFFTSIVFLLVGLISSDRVYAETQGLGGWLRGTWWSGNTLVEDMTFSWTNGVYAQVRAGDRVYYERHIWHCDTVGLQWCDSTNGGTLLFTGANFDSWLLPNYNSTKDTSIGNGLIYNGCGTFQEDFTAKTSGGVNISGPVIAGWVINGSTGASCTTTPPPTPGCNSVSLSVIPSSSNTGQGLSFNISGDASTFVEDYINGTNAPNSSVVTGITSDAGARAWGFSGTAAQAGNHTWQRKWKHSDNGGASWSDWCSAQTNFSITFTPPSGPATCGIPPKWNTYGIDTYYDYGSYQVNDINKVATWYCINKCGGTGTSGPTMANVSGPGSTWVPTGITRTNNQGWDQIQDLKCTFPANGTLSVSTTPVSGGITVDGTSWGSAPQSRSLAPGSHTVSFGAVSGYNTPSNQSVTVTSNTTSTVTGTYTVQGALSVTTSPPSGPITVNGVLWGNAPQSRSLAPGTYTVSFGAVSGYTTPANQSATVGSSGTTSVSGWYAPITGGGYTEISSPIVKANGTTQYTLTFTGISAGGASVMTGEVIHINSWSRDYILWSGSTRHSNWVNNVTIFELTCGGGVGGWAYPVYNSAPTIYTRFLNCSVSDINSTSRRLTTTVVFNPAFTSPITGNKVDAYSTIGGVGNYASQVATFDLEQPPNPTVTSVTADPISSYQNQSFLINMTITDPQGGGDVGSAYVMINRDGANAGQYRGYLGWSSQGFPSWGGSYASIANCTNGTNPAGQVALYNGYGNANIAITNCYRSVSGNTVTLSFGVTPLYTLPTSNTFSGYALDVSGNVFNWAPFGTFSIYPPPTGSTSISASPVNNDALTPYVISLGVTDPKGVGNIASIWGYINEYNPSPSTSRGYLSWTPANNNFGFANIPCTGGGYFYPWPSSAYDGNKYLNFISCRITDAGTTKTLAVTVTFNPIFLTPLTGNRIVNSIGSQALFDITVVNPTATFSGKITDGSSCAAGAPAISNLQSGNIYETQVPGNTASINTSTGNYSLANVTLKTSPAVNLFCANLTPPSGGSYKLACATSSTGTASVNGNCAQVDGATGAAVTLNMGFRLITQVAWYQTLLSDIYSNYGSGGDGIYKRLPPDAAPYSSSPFLSDIASASSDNYSTGIAISKASVNVQDDGGTDKTSNNSLKNSSSSYKNYKLSAYDAKFGFGRTINFGSAPSGATNVSSCGSFFDGSSRSAGVYKMTSSCFSTAMGGSDKTYNFGGGTSVIYVTGGGITIGYKLQGSNNSRLVLVVDGDITVSKNVGSATITQATVGDIQATLIAKGKITFETNGTLTDTSVVVDGAVITTNTNNGKISFLRDRGSNNITYPGVLIRFKPKDLVDMTLSLEPSSNDTTGLFINDVRWSSD